MNDQVLFRLVAEFIETNLDKNLGQPFLYSKFEVGRFRLNRVFRHFTGRSVGHYIRDKRFERACSLLISSNKSVKEIAFTCGYRHVSSFSQAFTKKFGVSPVIMKYGGDSPGS